MTANNTPLDVVTFSGNGEPTLHPDFEGIVDDTLRLRDTYFPSAKVSVLSNSTRLDRDDVVRALRRVDNCILKLDSAIDATMRLIDRPGSPTFTVNTLLPRLQALGNKCIIQTMMLRGTHNGTPIDNTTPTEIDALIQAYIAINPAEVMLYSLDRPTPEQDLVKVERDELLQIGQRISSAGIKVQVS
jgi:wyosine [tRNA(Phe)-imidazoG37] synthetase (radical SAM superfamily)